MRSEDAILDSIYQGILSGDAAQTVEQTEVGLAAGIDATKLVFESMIPALEEVGRLFEEGEYYVPEMLVSARAMGAAMELLRPLLAAAGTEPIGTFVMGTVAGDIHDIGKNLCNVLLDGAGFDVVDLGVNVPAASFVDAIREHEPDVVGMSAFLTTTMGEIESNIRLIESAGLRDGVKIIVGGAPVDQRYADHAGADGYAPDGSAAVRLTKELLGLDAE